MLASLVHWLENHMAPCFFRENFGLSCPGCGSQRAFILLLKGDVAASIVQYPALIPFLLTLLFLLIHLFVKARKGGTWLMYMFLFTSGLVLGNFITRVFTEHT